MNRAKIYADHQAAIADQIAALQAALAKHATVANPDKNYGYIGDLTEVSARLADLVAFVG